MIIAELFVGTEIFKIFRYFRFRLILGFNFYSDINFEICLKIIRVQRRKIRQKSELTMLGSIQFWIKSVTRKIAVDLYLFSVAFYILFASVHLFNILFYFTVAENAGPYFQIINATLDRIAVYCLSFAVIPYILKKLRNKLLFLVFLVYMSVSFFISMFMVDFIVILISFLMLVWFFTSPRPLYGMGRETGISRLLAYIALIIASLEFSVLICWFIFSFFPELSQEGALKYLVDLETKVFLLTGCLAPFLAVTLFFSWTVKPFFLRCSFLSRLFSLFGEKDENMQINRQLFSIILFCAIAFSFVVAFYPYMPSLNVDSHLVGVDAQFYREWLETHGNEILLHVITLSFTKHPDRPLSMLFLYLAKHTSGVDALATIKLFPLILTPAVTLAVYFFVQQAGYSRLICLLASFLSFSSFYFSVIMYGFLLANWIALVELYLFMGFYFSSIREKSILKMAIAVLLSISLLFTHSWTWGMSLGALFTYLLLTLILERKSLTHYQLQLKFLAVTVLVNLIVGILRNYALGWWITDFETLRYAQSATSTCALQNFWDDLLYTFFHTMYGFFVNPVALFLAVLGAFIATFNKRQTNRYLISWLIASCVFFVLGSGWVIKGRILLNLPLPVFEALGLKGISNLIQKFFKENGRLPNASIILLVLLVNLNYVFRCSFVMSQIIFG